MVPSQSVALLALSILGPALAEDEIVWGSVVITNFGDRVPIISPDYSKLTTDGAQQMESLGSVFRERYIENGNATNGMNRTIRGISQNVLDDLQISVTTMFDVFVQQSTQAFLTGLYPPLNTLDSNSTSDTNSTSNQTTLEGPFSDLQYPQTYTASSLDPNYLFLNASANCPTFQSSFNTYLQSPEYTSAASTSSSQLRSYSPYLNYALPNTPLTYSNAYNIYDYLRFEQLHSPDPSSRPTDGVLSAARDLASASYQQIFGNTTADGGIRALPGAGLASFVGTSLLNNAETNGTQYKLTIGGTGDEALVSLFALLRLSDLHPQFLGLPELGSAAAFEMYSSKNLELAETRLPYPDLDSVRVRFLFKNGTGEELQSYPMMGQGDTEPDWTFGQFMDRLAGLAGGANGPAEWCRTCGAESVWCAYFTDGEVGLPGATVGSVVQKGGVSNVVAGVIGAMVTLAVVGVCLIAVMLLFGVRFTKRGKGVVGKRFGKKAKGDAPVAAAHKSKSSGLGGFKGGEKLASDIDLPKGGGEGFGISVVPTEGGGHRRVESWELREGRGRLEDQEGDDIKAVESRDHV